ncbi:MAG: insulinase family protein [Acidobacteria bacterium]|nr:insulinase family protein [Acidobacteriota bacterium]
MSSARRLPVLFVLALFALAAFAAPPEPAKTATPEKAPAAAAPDTTKLAVDPAVRVGKLANGLTYFIRKNARPEKRADLWLAVNAGSTLEDDDQQGLAHFVEHMAFNGTKNFKKLEIINFLEKLGMKFGPEINAFTSFDETVYMLKVPTDDAATLDKALLVLEDWSRAIAFEDEEIDKERGVLVEEWRLGRGAEARMRDKQFPVLFQGSRYAERLVIGKKEILETASHDSVRRFYRDWYRPDLMAVIAVGDFDPAKIEEGIRKHFSGLKNPEKPRARQAYPVPDHDQTLVSIASDPEATSTRVSVYYKLPRKDRDTVADYRRMLVERLYHAMVNARLEELRQRPDPPFLFAFSGSGSFVRTRDLAVQSAGVEQSGLARGLDALLVELARVDKHGFNATELERAKKELLRGFERAFRERDKQEHELYSREIMDYFLEGEPMPGIETEVNLAMRFVPAMTLEELNGLARQWAGEKNRVILVNGPEKKDVALPSEAQVREVFRAAMAKEVEPWVDRVRQEPLVPEPPKPATIKEESAIAELGLTRWKLSNGATVLMKPTDFKNDQVLLTGFSPGGSSLVPNERYVSTSFAAQVLGEGGLGKFDQVELQKALAGKIASAGAYIGELEEAIRGNASPQDLETMFQLVYLNFTAPRADQKAFASWKARTAAMLQNRLARPETVFGDKMMVTLAQGHFRARPITPELLNEIDLAAAEAAWRERFADASDFTFVLVGAFKVDEVRPWVLTYLGGLPSTGRKEAWKDVGLRPPDGVVKVEVKKGLEPKSQVRIQFTGDAKWTREADHLMSSMGQALRIRLREVLREDLGGVYGVGAGGYLSRRPVEQYSFSVSFGCSPDRVAELQKAVFEVIEAVKKDGFSDEIVTKVHEQQVRGREEALKENGFWLGELADAARFNEDPKQILKYDELVKLVTKDSLRDAARRYLNAERYVAGVLLPEAPAAPAAAPAASPAPPAGGSGVR